VLGSLSSSVFEPELRILQRSTRDMYLISGSRSPNFGSRAATSADVKFDRDAMVEVALTATWKYGREKSEKRFWL